MKIEKVLLIHSAHHAANGELVQAKGRARRLYVWNVAEGALPLLAAYTPAHIRVELVEDYFDEMPWDTDAQVVGISAQLMMLSRATELADAFRARGKVVVMGGYLPTLSPEAVKDHVDALCIGEGDRMWPQMLADIEAGTLKKVYQAEGPIDCTSIPTPRYDLIKRDRFVTLPVQATRGCPFECEYCSIIQFFGKTYRYRPIKDVLRDLEATKSKYVHFVDDNLMENRRWVKELFREMKGMGKIWMAQVTVNIAQDEELLALAYEAGCRGACVGIESLSQRNLDVMQKPFNHVERFEKAFRTIQDSGIGVHALIVFGLPEDTRDTFDLTVDFLEHCNVAIAEMFIYTPYPHTPAGARELAEGRVVDQDPNHYRESYVVFRHPNLTSEEIVEGFWRAYDRIYSWESITKRIWRGSFKDKPLHLVTNLNYAAKVSRRIVPVYFGRGN